MALKGTRKGNDFESLVAAYTGFERRRLSGVLDRGDLALKKWVAQIKCPGRGKPVKITEAMNQAKRQAANAGVERYAVITRKTGYPIDEAHFTIPLWLAKQLELLE